MNFDATIDNIIEELLNSKNIFISYKTSFFVDLLRNKSSLIIDEKRITDLIKNKITKHTNKIYFFEKKVIDKNKIKLGLSDLEDALDTSTAMLLCRNNHIKYYLHSSVLEEQDFFLLKIQLILVRTGEIVFGKTEKFYW
ncbi:hypothetical protein [Buchnera aphidicola]|uniref:hypothetical protein n=1 Tax=Buchnera aphidicola TaxID=9 RepID=UPI00046CD39C|nr:hypothetical protein [Buchnera aphidicola]WAI03286.1 MAG: hypothetical protein OW722_00915 [Buchnera aphidicola (Myzus persicae)]